MLLLRDLGGGIGGLGWGSVSVLSHSERCLLYIYSKIMLVKLYTAFESFLILLINLYF